MSSSSTLLARFIGRTLKPTIVKWRAYWDVDHLVAHTFRTEEQYEQWLEQAKENNRMLKKQAVKEYAKTHMLPRIVLREGSFIPRYETSTEQQQQQQSAQEEEENPSRGLSEFNKHVVAGGFAFTPLLFVLLFILQHELRNPQPPYSPLGGGGAAAAPAAEETAEMLKKKGTKQLKEHGIPSSSFSPSSSSGPMEQIDHWSGIRSGSSSSGSSFILHTTPEVDGDQRGRGTDIEASPIATIAAAAVQEHIPPSAALLERLSLVEEELHDLRQKLKASTSSSTAPPPTSISSPPTQLQSRSEEITISSPSISTTHTFARGGAALE